MTMSVITSEELEALPFSVSTHLSKLVHKYLRKAKLGGSAWEFCSLLHDRTFGDAGYHRQKGHREYWCQFDLAVWAAELEISKSNLQRIMAELKACDIIFYMPDQNNPGSGRVGWNIHFEEWQRYDGRRAKARSAEDARKQSSVVIFQGAPPEVPSEHHGSNEASLPERDERQPDLTIRKINTGARFHGAVSGKITMDAYPDARKITMPVCSQINMGACLEDQDSSAPAAPVIKATKEKDTEEYPPYGGALAAPAAQAGPAAVLPAHPAAPPAHSSSSHTPPHPEAPPTGEAAPGSPRAPSAVPPGAFCWPARKAGERDLDYYQRVLADADENSAVKLLMQLAFEKIGVSREHANYGRMTILARKHRAAMMVRHILHAAGDHIDKDPMDYLTWLANGKQREERNDGRTGTQRRATYQPSKERVAAADSPPGRDPSGNAWDGYTHRVVEV